LQRQQANLDTEGSSPDIIGDPVRITQLLTNLVANGLKYNRALVPRVVVGAMDCQDDPAQVMIFVRDNGIGIDPAFHQQIFGIFRRLHKGDEYEGTGAGLAICQKIVEGHGGRIWVESALGQGATFFFTLPRSQGKAANASANGVHYLGEERKSDAPPSSAARRRNAAAAETVSAGPSPRIVLVEDQTEVSFLIQKLGKRDGLEITWFATAEEAWEYLQKESADLLLLDVNLPGISGVELCQRLRKLPHLAETPVAIFTPEQDPEHLQELRAAGADFFLSKDLLTQPVVWQKKVQELLEQIRQPLAP
jgi:CheY-like chemotaxis protein